jgi:Flp pilus assembly pilin Flp
MQRRVMAALTRAGVPTDPTGQAMVEYAIVTALLAIAALAALEGFGDGVKGAFDAIIDKLPT